MGGAWLAAIGLSAAPCVAEGAAVDRVRLDYSTDDPSCPDADAFRRQVEGQLERSAFADDSALTVRVRVTRHGDELEGSLALLGAGDEEGVQPFAAPVPRCEELVATMSLAAVIAIERLRQQGPKPARSLRVGVARPQQASASTSAYRLATYAGAGMALGHVPDPSVGAVLGLDLARHGLQLGLRAELFAASHAEAPGGMVKVQLSRVDLLACHSTWSLALCGVFAAGALSGAGSDTNRSQLQTVFFPSAGIRAGWRHPFGDVFELAIDAGVDFALSRPTFALHDGPRAADIWQPSLLGLSLTGGLTTRLFP